MYEIRVALRKLILDEWTPAESLGLGLAATDSGEDDIAVSLGGSPDEELPYPQITIRGAGGSGGVRGLKGTGRGFVNQYDGRADIQVWAGSYQTLPPSFEASGQRYDPQEAGSKIGTQVRDIVQEEYLGVPDPDSSTGDTLTTDLRALSFPFILQDPDMGPEPYYYATVETGYRIRA